MAKKKAHMHVRLVVDNDPKFIQLCRDQAQPRPAGPESPHSVQAPPRKAFLFASSCSRAAETPAGNQCQGVERTQNHHQQQQSGERFETGSCSDIKHGVYQVSNHMFNTDLNALFNLNGMKDRDRPIDRALARAESLGMNKSQFASALGVDPQNVTNWIRRGMPADRYAKAAEVLGWKVDQLLRSEDVKELPAAYWPFKIPYDQYASLDFEQRMEIEEIIEDRIMRFKAKSKPKRKAIR